MAARAGTRPRTRAAALHVPVRFRGIPVVDRRLIETARRQAVPVYVWTVNDPREMQRLADLGVDGLITDRPDLARRMEPAP